MFDLSKFNEYREDNRCEIKKAREGLPDSLWSTYSAFANCYGGVIILGVSENKDGSWQTTGLQSVDKLRKDFWNTINNLQKVNKNLLTDKDVQLYQIDKDVIMVIYVPAAKREEKPIYVGTDMFKGTYRRNWEGDYHCTSGEIKAMLRDQTEDSMDMKVLGDMQMDVFNQETVHSYRNRHMAYRREHVWQQLGDEDYLERVGAARMSYLDGKMHPTAAGLLMFGDEYKIVYEYPEYFLDFRELLDPSIRWTDRLQSGSGDWTGNLFDFFFRVYGKLVKDVKIPFKLEGAVRVDDTPVHKAIREALANCLVNTDFYLPRGVVIKKESDGIVMENPGSIRTGKKQMLKGGISDPRNKALMKMFNMIGIGERAGSGVPDIYAVWESQGWIMPQVIEEYAPDRTILRLSFLTKTEEKKAIKKSDRKKVTEKSDRKKVTEKTRKQLQVVLNNMQPEKEYKVEEVADWLDVGRSRARTLLKMLVDDNKVVETGITKMKRYRINR
ncbi:MAG: putative DNA binding domain-containing protein [Lachnospiraceae bacterium]|nr:putative DNA binding domain-containing protein [Lachnospiraceae bacterium]